VLASRNKLDFEWRINCRGTDDGIYDRASLKGATFYIINDRFVFNAHRPRSRTYSLWRDRVAIKDENASGRPLIGFGRLLTRRLLVTFPRRVDFVF
jgi:hypothetical protein